MAHTLHENMAAGFTTDNLHPNDNISIHFYDSMRVGIGAVLLSKYGLTQLIDFISNANVPSRKAILPDNFKNRIVMEWYYDDGDMCVRLIFEFGEDPWQCIVFDQELASQLVGRLELIVSEMAKPKITCKCCKGTGKIVLLTSIVDCDCVR